jgi:hypothetical protein
MQKAARTAAQTHRRLDQPADPKARAIKLKFKSRLSQRRCQVPLDIAGATPGS